MWTSLKTYPVGKTILWYGYKPGACNDYSNTAQAGHFVTAVSERFAQSPARHIGALL
jgi:hypothetical protein